MIELLLQADRTLTMGLVDQAERLYRQAAEADPLNAMAVVGLARVALERGQDRQAWTLAVHALELDALDTSAIRLESRLAEILATRGEPVDRPDWVVSNEAAWRARGTADLSARAAGMPRPAPPIAVYPVASDDPRAASVAASATMASSPTTAQSPAEPPDTATPTHATEAPATAETPVGAEPRPPVKRGWLARLLGRG